MYKNSIWFESFVDNTWNTPPYIYIEWLEYPSLHIKRFHTLWSRFSKQKSSRSCRWPKFFKNSVKGWGLSLVNNKKSINGSVRSITKIGPKKFPDSLTSICNTRKQDVQSDISVRYQCHRASSRASSSAADLSLPKRFHWRNILVLNRSGMRTGWRGWNTWQPLLDWRCRTCPKQLSFWVSVSWDFNPSSTTKIKSRKVCDFRWT